MVTDTLRRQNYIEQLSLRNTDNSDLTFAKPIIEQLKIKNPTQKFFEEIEEEFKEKEELVKFKNSIKTDNEFKKELRRKKD